MSYRVGKTYGHERGLSACFRQWRAESHCNKMHGYALSVHIEFEAKTLDENNWVIDFGGLRSIKDWLDDMFDHKTLVARDDPKLETFRALHAFDVCDVVEVDHVGCEAFAQMVGEYVERWLDENDNPTVSLHHVTVREHGANSATWIPEASEWH